jgi:hypothetical protein
MARSLIYVFFARKSKNSLSSEKGRRAVGKASGATFAFFGAILAMAKQ